jgi:Xaa-Pro aminopeptidase
MRIDKIRELLNEQDIDAMVVSNIKNVRYISNFTGDEGMAVITDKSAYLIVDGRFTEQAKSQSKINVVDYGGNFVKTIGEILKNDSSKKCAFEGNTMTYSEAEHMMNTINFVSWVAQKDVFERVRMIKDIGEIKIIKKSLQIALDTFEYVKPQIVAGVREIDIANEIEYTMKKMGASGPSFDTIVASGKRSALPHGVASNKVIENGDAVVVDMGAVYDGYCSDITRTVFVGGMSKEQERIYDLVAKAQKFAIDAIEEGVSCKEVNEVAVNEFRKNAMDKYFVHSLGHGVGLDVHERPFVAGKSSDVFKPGMVVTVEPGLYLPDKFGVRIEDMIMLSPEGEE